MRDANGVRYESLAERAERLQRELDTAHAKLAQIVSDLKQAGARGENVASLVFDLAAQLTAAQTELHRAQGLAYAMLELAPDVIVGDVREKARGYVAQLDTARAELAQVKAELAQAKAMSEAGWGAASVTSEDVMQEVESRLPEIIKELRSKLAACQDDYAASVKSNHDKHLEYLEQKKSADAARAHVAALVSHIEMSERFINRAYGMLPKDNFDYLNDDYMVVIMSTVARAAREWLEGTSGETE